MPVPISLLADTDLLSSVDTPTLERLAAVAQEKTLARREVVLNKGNAPQSLLFLLDGRLQGIDFTLDGREVGLYFVDPGDYFGELGIIDGAPHPETVIALAPSRVILLPKEQIRSLIFSSPEVTEKVSMRLARKLRAVSGQRLLLALPNPLQRVCTQLLLLATENNRGSGEIPAAPTHQELAIMINTSRETVTRAFQLLQAQLVLKRDGNRLVVLNVELLRDIAEGRADQVKL